VKNKLRDVKEILKKILLVEFSFISTMGHGGQDDKEVVTQIDFKFKEQLCSAASCAKCQLVI
jgi:hypothetical protein